MAIPAIPQIRHFLHYCNFLGAGNEEPERIEISVENPWNFHASANFRLSESARERVN
jgi:hypothetical protein